MSNYCITSCQQMHPSHVCWRPNHSHPQHSDIAYVTSFGHHSLVVDSSAPANSTSWNYAIPTYASLGIPGGSVAYEWEPPAKWPYSCSHEWRPEARQFGVRVDFGSWKTH